jgi:hypothetical protein
MSARLHAGVIALAIALGGVSLARAAGAPRVEVRLIAAFHTDGGAAIDAKLADLPQLTRDQPFVQYNVYRLLEARQFPLETGKTVTYVLVNGRTLEVTLGGIVEARNEKRYRIEAEIVEPGRRAFLKSLHVTAGPNQPFFVGGQQYQGGTLFLEVVVRP